MNIGPIMMVLCNKCGWTMNDDFAVCPKCMHLNGTVPEPLPHACDKCLRTGVVESSTGECQACGHQNYIQERRNEK